MNNGKIFLSPIDSYCGASIPSTIFAHEAVWKSNDGPVGFGRSHESNEVLRSLLRKSVRLDLENQSLIRYSDLFDRDPSEFCKGNASKGRYFAAPLVFEPSAKCELTLADLMETPVSGYFWQALAGPPIEAIEVMKPFLDECKYVVFWHPLEWSLLAISLKPDGFVEDLRLAAKRIKIAFEVLERNAGLPAW